MRVGRTGVEPVISGAALNRCRSEGSESQPHPTLSRYRYDPTVPDADKEQRSMPVLIPQPTRIEAAGNKPKLIDEYVGRVNSGHAEASIAHMRSPGGWVEPGQTPEFDEFTVV